MSCHVASRHVMTCHFCKTQLHLKITVPCIADRAMLCSDCNNDNDFEITLRADLSEYIGHEQIMTFDYDNQEILAKFPSTIKTELSKETKLYFDLTQVSLFDAKTEERI